MGTKVEDIMTPDPLTLPPTATVGEAYSLMRDRGFRHVPVTEGPLLLGVVSLTDIGHLGATIPEILAKPLHEVMTKKLVACKPEVSVAAAATMMASKKINCLLVCVDTGLVGIVTTYDLLDALAKSLREEAGN
jgi:acetoin utilization protein AcuB